MLQGTGISAPTRATVKTTCTHSAFWHGNESEISPARYWRDRSGLGRLLILLFAAKGAVAVKMHAAGRVT